MQYYAISLGRFPGNTWWWIGARKRLILSIGTCLNRHRKTKYLRRAGKQGFQASETIAGQSHGWVVVARSVLEILSAGDTKGEATSNFAAFRRQEHTQKPTPP